MKIVTAIDSFKGSMTSVEAGKAFAEGIRRVKGDAIVEVRPLADGGEGTVEALVEGMQGTYADVTVTGPMGKPVVCRYGIIRGDSQNDENAELTAVIEMSGAAGITLLPREELNPLNATTYGVGEVIRDAIQRGCRRFIVGIGGSATNDGGAGMLQALGYGLLDRTGEPIERGAKGLEKLHQITDENVIPELKECRFMIACDVNNPLCGPNGCSAVYGPQKGATPSMVEEMDRWIANYAALAGVKYPSADDTYPGTGAAGGMGFAFLTFTNAELTPGIELVLRETKLEEYIKDADLVITGEGRLDGQTAMGKAPVGVATLGKKYQKTVIAFAGGVTKDAKACNEKGIDAFFPIVRGITTLDEAMNPENALANMADAAEQAMRLYLIGR